MIRLMYGQVIWCTVLQVHKSSLYVCITCSKRVKTSEVAHIWRCSIYIQDYILYHFLSPIEDDQQYAHIDTYEIMRWA